MTTAPTERNQIGNDIAQFRDGHTFLLHGITITQSYAIVFQSLVVNGDTIRSTDGILTTVTLTDRILFIVLTIEVELQVVDDFAGLFGQTVFLDQRHNGQLHRCKGCRQLQHYAGFAIFQLFFTVGCAHNAEEHTVYTDRGFDNVWHIAFVDFRIEVLDALA